jgi:hypothetical protein
LAADQSHFQNVSLQVAPPDRRLFSYDRPAGRSQGAVGLSAATANLSISLITYVMLIVSALACFLFMRLSAMPRAASSLRVHWVQSQQSR